MNRMKYKVGDRVDYYIQDEDGLTYKHGFIKAIRKGLFKTIYVVLAVRSETIHILDESSIFGKLDKKEPNKQAAN